MSNLLPVQEMTWREGWGYISLKLNDPLAGQYKSTGLIKIENHTVSFSPSAIVSYLPSARLPDDSGYRVDIPEVNGGQPITILFWKEYPEAEAGSRYGGRLYYPFTVSEDNHA